MPQTVENTLLGGSLPHPNGWDVAVTLETEHGFQVSRMAPALTEALASYQAILAELERP